jgi:hypothetical protein
MKSRNMLIASAVAITIRQRRRGGRWLQGVVNVMLRFKLLSAQDQAFKITSMTGP